MTKDQHHTIMGDFLKIYHGIPDGNEKVLDEKLDYLWEQFIKANLTHISEEKFKHALEKDFHKGRMMQNLLLEKRRISDN